ncbi:MAG: hypothetical protein CEE43_13810 [Promethearchaeota archaeon Loki_b32]|nr:MAG: hypothetical protein CEE43_13810 [Candidatus Lokiarchaeota archaeon Loki_b32]
MVVTINLKSTEASNNLMSVEEYSEGVKILKKFLAILQQGARGYRVFQILEGIEDLEVWNLGSHRLEKNWWNWKEGTFKKGHNPYKVVGFEVEIEHIINKATKE